MPSTASSENGSAPGAAASNGSATNGSARNGSAREAESPAASAASAIGTDRWSAWAERIVGGDSIDRETAREILEVGPAGLMDLVSAAFKIRRHYYGLTVKLNYLVNAKSGLCPEDCGYCSQSRDSTAAIDRYPVMDEEEIIEQAEEAVANKASTCCIVLSGRGPSEKEVDRVGSAVRTIKERHPDLKICACMGILRDGQAERLREAGVDRYNHNVNTAESHHDEIVSTHTYEDRTETVKKADGAGISPCSGVIVGLGEDRSELVDSAFALRELGADSIPVNFLIPIEGTPMEDRGGELDPRYCLKVLCMFRFVCPDREIRISAGREVHLGHLQPMALYPANSMFVSDYLTEPGQEASSDWAMIEDLGFEVEPIGGPMGPQPDGPPTSD